jgi:hypothetical protein
VNAFFYSLSWFYARIFCSVRDKLSNVSRQIWENRYLLGCWWSEKFLFVFNFWDRIASLWKYPVDDVDLKILFYQGQQVSLRHLGGYLCYQCGEMKPAKVLN